MDSRMIEHLRLEAKSHDLEDVCTSDFQGSRQELLDLAADEIAALRGALAQCRGMALEGCDAPNAAYRWCERIEEVAVAGSPLSEYIEWAYVAQKEPK